MARSKSSTCLLARAPRAAGNRPIALAVLMASLSAWDLGTKPWTAGALLLVSVAPQASGPLEVSSAPETSGPSWAPRGSLLRGGEEKKKKKQAHPGFQRVVAEGTLSQCHTYQVGGLG